MEAMGALSIYQALSARGVECVDPRNYLSITREQMIAFFRKNLHKAEALLIKNRPEKPAHDVLCMDSRNGRFVIYDIDHGSERSHYWYKSLPEAAADFVAFHIGYGYPDGYGFKNG